MNVKPITPEEAHSKKIESIPPVVIKIFNDFIVENYSQITKTSRVEQKDVVSKIVEELNLTRGEVYSRGYCDVEEIFRRAGWKVFYDKPGYNESYDAFFVFSKV